MKVVILSTLVLLPASAFAVAPAYVATPVPLPGLPANFAGGWTNVRGFNARGDILLQSVMSVYEDDNLWRARGSAFVDGQTGTLQTIFPISRDESRLAVSLNAGGSVLIYDGDLRTLQVWNSGMFAPVGVAGHLYSWGSINSAGNVSTVRVEYTQVGDTITEYNTPVLLNGGVETAIGPTWRPEQPEYGTFYPSSLSESGRIAGGVLVGERLYKAAYWSNGLITILPSPEGRTTFVEGETSDGVLYGMLEVDAYHSLPCLWVNGQFQLIDLPEGFDNGRIVSAPTSDEVALSVYNSEENVGAAYLLRDGVFTNANDLTVIGDPGLRIGLLINTRGQILASGPSLDIPSRYLLNPVPEPTAFSTVALIAMTGMRRRRTA